MAYVTECDDHERCLVIESDGWPSKRGSFRSHFDDDMDPAARLNRDHPDQATIEDRRSSTATDTLERRESTSEEQARLEGRRV